MADINNVNNPYGLIQQAGKRTRSKKQIYRARVKTSVCRLSKKTCRKRNGCKRTRAGKRRSYCRKRTNRHA